ncbi:hypothetical protein NDU88_006162 [Pleurodeles waltl]|uniref:Uncharacterized protein n=1 Tax=Pleurodeles waltl TaxID=8319 RepID=A0AAV7MYR9_PLEWA|nr:hypothetical protein NDU88_006162 [Pleurodeles waltl]
MDPKVLREAGRLDLVTPEALAPGRPVRRASPGVAAAVVACSPPRSSSGGTVSLCGGGALREAGPGTGGAGRGHGLRGSTAGESPGASLGERQVWRARAGDSNARRGLVVRRYGARPGAKPKIRAGLVPGCAAAVVKRAGGSAGGGQPGDFDIRGRRAGAETRAFSGGRKRVSGVRKLSPVGGGEGDKV